jgi:thymidylate kinase
MSKFKNSDRKVWCVTDDFKILEWPYQRVEEHIEWGSCFSRNKYYIEFPGSDVTFYFTREYAVKQARKNREEKISWWKKDIESAYRSIDESISAIETALKVEII